MKTWLWVALLCGASSTAAAQELTARQIVDRAVARSAFGFDNAIAKVRLELRGAHGDKTRDIEIRAKQAGGLGKTLVRFHAPAEVAGTGFLVIERDGADDEQYLYLPALGKVKRITGSQKHQRFMGTDLTHADLEWSELRRAALTRRPDAAVGTSPTYVIEARADNDDDSAYGYTVTYIHKDSFVPLKVEFFDKQGKPHKTMLVRRLEKRGGRWVATETHIKDVQAGSETVMRIHELSPQTALDDAEFTERALVGG